MLGKDEPWAFVFPQRGNALPNYEHWVPRYLDYLFLAFTTSFAFSPTDTLPLTRTAKMLMLAAGHHFGDHADRDRRKRHRHRGRSFVGSVTADDEHNFSG